LIEYIVVVIVVGPLSKSFWNNTNHRGLLFIEHVLLIDKSVWHLCADDTKTYHKYDRSNDLERRTAPVSLPNERVFTNQRFKMTQTLSHRFIFKNY